MRRSIRAVGLPAATRGAEGTDLARLSYVVELQDVLRQTRATMTDTFSFLQRPSLTNCEETQESEE